MTNNRLQQLRECGQSLWMDYLSRDLIQSGELQQKVEAGWLRGMTSNPSIFEKAIKGNQIYQPDIEEGIRNKWSAQEIYESLAITDVQNACDVLRPVFEETEGLDGYVSIEVSPLLARDLNGTLEEARTFFRRVDRPNVMIKIPGTPEGMGAIEQAISEGMNVNVTLLFSVDMYAQAAEAYIRGLEKRAEAGQPIDKLSSVASFFISRIDAKVDELIDERLKRQGTESLSEEKRLESVKGRVAIANAKLAYKRFQEIFGSDRWNALKAKGANPQRLLWASTGTKNPNYSDVLYVDELVARDTVNTMPLETIEACEDHCQVGCDRILENLDHAQTLIDSLSDPDIDINLATIMDELLEEGIEKFNQPYNSLLKSIEEKVQQL
ncbi:MAG TPA: transaldolase, partial [Leptolyngbyaceae cyanobacterium]